MVFILELYLWCWADDFVYGDSELEWALSEPVLSITLPGKIAFVRMEQ